MTKEDLNTDRVNYLIWQYLQQSNYRETALKLQSEWNIENPQQLDFASHVKPHTLVAVLQRGLLYNEAERNKRQARREVAAPLPGFFGPVCRLSSPPHENEQEYVNIRKRSVDQRQPASTESLSKRTKLSNGHENGIDSTPMEIDEAVNGNGHAYPSPKEVEEPLLPPPPATITDGPEKGTQIEKVAELSSETTFLTLQDSSASRNPILLHCEWNPNDPTILAAAGTDALARLWTVSRGAPHETNHVSRMSPPCRDLVDESLSGVSSITALAWTRDGGAIAIASDSEDGGTAVITVWGKDGSPCLKFTDQEPPVHCLRWSPTGYLILALMPVLDGNVVKVFSPGNCQTVEYSMPKGVQPLDATWLSAFEFVLCGGDTLCAFRCENGVISVCRKFETREASEFMMVKFDERSELLATASSNGFVDIWDHNGDRKTIKAHEGSVISLLWQPVPDVYDDSKERLLVSSGEDGVINIWNTRGDMLKPVCFMNMEATVVAMAITPDGAFLAGATSAHILIWRLADTTVPRARWVRGPEPGWQSPKMDSMTLEEDQHCLCWDADGQKLAYGVNSQLAVIKWRPFGDGNGS